MHCEEGCDIRRTASHSQSFAAPLTSPSAVANRWVRRSKPPRPKAAARGPAARKQPTTASIGMKSDAQGSDRLDRPAREGAAERAQHGRQV